MSMTKMENACSSAWDEVTLDGKGQWLAEAMNAGCEAMDLLQEMYWKFQDDRSLKASYLHVQIEGLLKEWHDQ